MRFGFIIIGAFIFLSACATGQGFVNLMNSYMGASEQALVYRFGVPSNVYTAPNGDRTVSFARSRTTTVGESAPTYTSTDIGGVLYTTSQGGSPGVTHTYTCTLHFTLRDDRVIDWGSSGNHCVA
ncbi:hypothetical protein ACVDG3_18105 [Meridianimarinicoccus sp. RP-17]|uniref:hypothetical protein n=1 Tax=Meridianimarinicoccus zhengii TaxID=2056810 RepID=UPI000DABB0A8|nr:hypothetical protein [Phycocomes zhengii]